MRFDGSLTTYSAVFIATTMVDAMDLRPRIDRASRTPSSSGGTCTFGLGVGAPLCACGRCRPRSEPSSSDPSLDPIPPSSASDADSDRSDSSASRAIIALMVWRPLAGGFAAAPFFRFVPETTELYLGCESSLSSPLIVCGELVVVQERVHYPSVCAVCDYPLDACVKVGRARSEVYRGRG